MVQVSLDRKQPSHGALTCVDMILRWDCSFAKESSFSLTLLQLCER